MAGWSRRLTLVAACLGALSGPGAIPLAIAGEMPALDLVVDARDLPRRLLHTRMEVPCRPGKLVLWFPKWIPGTHAPCGPVADVAGLRLEAPEGTILTWH